MRTLMATGLLAAALIAPLQSPTQSSAAPTPIHVVSVTGKDTEGVAVSTYPAFDVGVDRFAVRSVNSLGRLTVTATSADANAVVRIDGVPATNGIATDVEGLTPGGEVNVQITDAGGTSNQSWILTPAGFPKLQASGPSQDLSEGMVFVGLQSFLGTPYSAIVDANAVPVRATASTGTDFKQSGADRQHYSIALPGTDGGWQIVELDDKFGQIGAGRQLKDRPQSTDFHDSALLPDGGVLLMGYDSMWRDGQQFIDALVEVQDASGEPTFTWNSKDHVGAAESYVDRSADDYAHINSLQQLANGDILASFRNISQVMLIAGSDHDGFESGDPIWRLGGLRNDFAFVDDPYAGPCAQHAATVLDNGHLLIFDNGARRDDAGPIASQTANMCPNGSDPGGPRVARPQSRITEYELDTTVTPPTATLVWSHRIVGRYAPFAGNAQRLPNGNTLAGWSLSESPAGESSPVATEVRADGTEIWSMTANGYFSYRAFKYPAPDRIDPKATITSPADGATLTAGARVDATFACSDTGGSNLDTCVSSLPHGSDLTRQLGTHTLSLTATDRSGNTSADSVTYTVVPAPPIPPTAPTAPTAPTTSPTPAPTARADAMIRRSGGRWKGRNSYDKKSQQVTYRTTAPRRLIAHVLVRNSGARTGRLTLRGSRGNRWSSVRWFAGKRDVTARVVAGTFRTPALDAGDALRLRLVVKVSRTDRVHTRTLRLAASNRGQGKDVVRARIRVR